MIFELSSAHADVRAQARAFAATIRAAAVEYDTSGNIPPAVAHEASTFASDDLQALVFATEEIATASAAVAVMAGAKNSGSGARLSGLRGAPGIDGSSRSHLAMAAVALGIGRAAMDAALDELRQTAVRPSADTEKPHWVVADVATDLDAARLLTHKAAVTGNDADVAIARLMAVAAASRAVDAAVRILGAPALQPGHVVERLARDVRAVAVVGGTEEDQRATAAAGLLPR